MALHLAQQMAHPFVKDLAWLVEGHYITRDFQLESYWVEDIQRRLFALDQQPEALILAVSACKSHFMGRYFETLFSYAIEHLSTLTIQLEHLQIQADGKTLGEIDMLVETPEGGLHQFEIAVKFYLQRPDFHPNDWIGPNKNDSLAKKVSRANAHQLTILHTEEGKAAIAKVSKGRTPRANLLIFGRLYEALKTPKDIDHWFNQSSHGGWVRVSDLMLLAQHFSHYRCLEKPHWLAQTDSNGKFTFNSLQSAYNPVGIFLQDDRPKHLLLWPIPKHAETLQRPVFVVPDTW
ncbi:DUF1853 family protein [Marinomonas sp. IMCC 4694]|uniref:DUF1853 family protein n=1 Tax=Marinomonas sp. IMCC 4694 TaxID=2605432 RepID=UPI0011E692CD|nr:DUF1853 family protein [Marinomonas sp. IMCC 4694]TYL47526.1 DUF1853 family protein [Marinomonas sp. IMCC 4694]